MNDASSFALPLAALLSGMAAIYKAGMLAGRFNKHEQLIEQRVATLEAMNSTKITREEMNARFESIVSELHSLRGMLQRVLDHSPER